MLTPTKFRLSLNVFLCPSEGSEFPLATEQVGSRRFFPEALREESRGAFLFMGQMGQMGLIGLMGFMRVMAADGEALGTAAEGEARQLNGGLWVGCYL